MAMSLMTRLAEESDRKQISGLIDRLVLPQGVRRATFEFGEDSTGDAAVWIYFEIDEEFEPSAEEVAEFNALAQPTTSRLLEAGVLHWPYVQFRPVK